MPKQEIKTENKETIPEKKENPIKSEEPPAKKDEPKNEKKEIITGETPKEETIEEEKVEKDYYMLSDGLLCRIDESPVYSGFPDGFCHLERPRNRLLEKRQIVQASGGIIDTRNIGCRP